MFIEEIETEKRTLGDKFKEFGEKLGKLCELGYELLEEKDLSDKERSEFIDILAGIKGAKKGSYKLMERYSDLKSSDRKAIEKKADEFVKGLGLEEKDGKKC